MCSKYEIHRTVLFSQALAANNEFQDLCYNEKLLYLMRNEIKALSTFLQEAWKIGQESLYVQIPHVSYAQPSFDISDLLCLILYI